MPRRKWFIYSFLPTVLLYALAESLMDKATSKIFGMMKLEPFDWLFLFTIVILFLLSYECKRVSKQLGLFWEKVWGKIGWETRKEKWERQEKEKQDDWQRKQDDKQAEWERQQQEQQNKWDEERRKRQEARTKREFLINKLIKNAKVVDRLLGRDKGISSPYSELHEKCELITKISLTELKKYGFNLPDVLTVPIIGTDGPPRLSPENEKFYKNWREFCLYIVPFIQGEKEDRVQNIWHEEFGKS